MRSLIDAVAFLTRVPVPYDPHRRPDLARAAGWFPLVGALLGAGLLLLGCALGTVLPPLVVAVLLVGVEVPLVGALHLDGLADLADGTGGHDRASRLRIMKDHATGVYGTAAVVLALLLEVALLATLLATPTPSPAATWLPAPWLVGSAAGWVWLPLLGAAAWSLSRAAMLPVALLLPYAREEGTGRSVVEGLTTGRTLLACVVPLLLCLALGPVGLVALLGALGATVLVGVVGQRLLGGATGDVLGATAQLALLGALLAAAAVV
ncbi:MAG: adenosylcobinamide-GDP ribazoletransferase [Acidobacteria bacterium]|nr:MAG: adenosylcobinamide-GDP ribazoletransferase [Acidobacteriota bacterium]